MGFSRLQQLTDEQIKNGQIKLKGEYREDRTQLRRLINIHGHLVGEGSLVTLKAYVFGPIIPTRNAAPTVEANKELEKL